jgi:hypothetical protein
MPLASSSCELRCRIGASSSPSARAPSWRPVASMISRRSSRRRLSMASSSGARGFGLALQRRDAAHQHAAQAVVQVARQVHALADARMRELQRMLLRQRGGQLGLGGVHFLDQLGVEVLDAPQALHEAPACVSAMPSSSTYDDMSCSRCCCRSPA